MSASIQLQPKHISNPEFECMKMPEVARNAFLENARFTMDGSDDLEERLVKDCANVLEGVRKIIPNSDLEALVLGGGYGRGQGGVLCTSEGERPYNDLEFYVFVRGNVSMARLRHGPALQALGESLSATTGLHVEFKIDSLQKLRRSGISMYSYDLVARHKVICGERKLFKNCEHHLAATQIPASEATRLLFNRCSGLLLVKGLLRDTTLDFEQSDFIGRNLAKAQLGFGDAVLTFFGLYHWDCRERHRRLEKLRLPDLPPWLAELLHHHAVGVRFKLHPHRSHESHENLKPKFNELQQLGLKIWLWVESQRLNRRFDSAGDYALSNAQKCFGSGLLRNSLLNFKSFGPGIALRPGFFRYPRERLFNALCLFLWDDDAVLGEPALLQQLQASLRANSAAWDDLISAYRKLWQSYG